MVLYAWYSPLAACNEYFIYLSTSGNNIYVTTLTKSNKNPYHNTINNPYKTSYCTGLVAENMNYIKKFNKFEIK